MLQVLRLVRAICAAVLCKDTPHMLSMELAEVRAYVGCPRQQCPGCVRPCHVCEQALMCTAKRHLALLSTTMALECTDLATTKHRRAGGSRR